MNATGPSDNLFGETAAHNSKVKFGARETATNPAPRRALAFYDSCLSRVREQHDDLSVVQRTGLTSDKNSNTAQMEKLTWLDTARTRLRPSRRGCSVTRYTWHV